jgi:hypothetical protein
VAGLWLSVLRVLTMRRSNVLPALAASGFAMAAVLGGAAFAQTATPAPNAAEATADALKKAAAGSVAKPAAQTPATATDAAAAAPKQSTIAKAKAMLPWNKAKAAKAAAAGEGAPVDAAKAAPVKAAVPAKAAAVSAVDAPKVDAPKVEAAKADPASETAKPVAKSTKTPVPTKTTAAGTPVKGANGEVMSGPMAATHAFFGAGTYAAPAPSKTAVRAGCTRLAHSSIDVGKENPIKFSREGIDNQIAALTKTKGWKASSKSDEKIICTEYVNLGLFGQEYTCRVETTVCPK